MNNYPNFKNYSYTDSNMMSDMNMYNTSNISCDNQYKVQNKMIIPSTAESLYDPYNGFIRGNMFSNTYDPYKKTEPYEIKPMNEQAELLTYIDALGFAMIDLNIYLDVYPNDKECIDTFNQYRDEMKKLTKKYESKYGPITINSDSLNSFPWSWNDMPWPWDN